MTLAPTAPALETRCLVEPPEEALAYARDRITAALRRLRGRVGHTRLRLDDPNGPRGGVDKTCRVEVAIVGAPRLHVEATAASWTEAADLAADLLRRQLARRYDRARE